jgi:hypothetical protein
MAAEPRWGKMTIEWMGHPERRESKGQARAGETGHFKPSCKETATGDEEPGVAGFCSGETTPWECAWGWDRSSCTNG